MRAVLVLLVAIVFSLSGCGGDGEAPATAEPSPTPDAAATPDEPAQTGDEPEEPEAAEGPRKRPPGTRIVLGESEFGEMLFDSDRQAIYVYEQDREDETRCFGECARAWPPVHARGEPQAGREVDADLLGTIRRPNGRRQVTYAGRPLYYYVDEAPGEVRCHDVNLHGGFWWVIDAGGERLP
jgi:predicted lipoprotein with Yx(FWY)xxD motif